MKIRDRIKELRRVRAGDLIPNPRNWRTHPEAQQDAMRGILAEVGWADAVLARETEAGLQLIDGHLRAEVAPDEEVPVLVIDVDEAEADLILATHDPLAAMAEIDPAILDELLQDVNTSSEALQEMLAELAEAEGMYETPDEVIEDEIPEPPADPITKPGDLWILGDHRLLCGDSTKAEDIERVMGGDACDAVVTDPPYGIGEAAGKNKSRGHIAKARDYGNAAWDDKPIAGLVELLSQFPQQVVFGGNYYPFPPTTCWLIWDKENGANDFADCEMAWTNLRGAVRLKRHLWNGMIRKGGESREHPTQKPVGVIAWAVGFTEGNIYDPFLGSGTTLIAAEQLNRKCYGLEISPAYCDVIINRWEQLTDRKATLEKQPKKPAKKKRKARQTATA